MNALECETLCRCLQALEDSSVALDTTLLLRYLVSTKHLPLTAHQSQLIQAQPTQIDRVRLLVNTLTKLPGARLCDFVDALTVVEAPPHLVSVIQDTRREVSNWRLTEQQAQAIISRYSGQTFDPLLGGNILGTLQHAVILKHSDEERYWISADSGDLKRVESLLRLSPEERSLISRRLAERVDPRHLMERCHLLEPHWQQLAIRADMANRVYSIKHDNRTEMDRTIAFIDAFAKKYHPQLSFSFIVTTFMGIVDDSLLTAILAVPQLKNKTASVAAFLRESLNATT